MTIRATGSYTLVPYAGADTLVTETVVLVPFDLDESSRLTLTAYAPTAQTTIQANPPEAVNGLEITAYAPTVECGIRLVITPYPPVVGQKLEISPPTATTLTITGYAPESDACWVWVREAPVDEDWTMIC